MPCILVAAAKNGRPMYWQTPGAGRARVLDHNGSALYDERGKPMFHRDDAGRVQWREVGGWCWRREYATRYPTLSMALDVNALRDLRAEAEEV